MPGCFDVTLLHVFTCYTSCVEKLLWSGVLTICASLSEKQDSHTYPQRRVTRCSICTSYLSNLQRHRVFQYVPN